MGPHGRGEHHLPQGDRDAPTTPRHERAELIEEYTERFANPYIAAERGYVDDVIDPRDTRKVLVRSLDDAAHEARAAAVSASTGTCRSDEAGALRWPSCGRSRPTRRPRRSRRSSPRSPSSHAARRWSRPPTRDESLHEWVHARPPRRAGARPAARPVAAVRPHRRRSRLTARLGPRMPDGRQRRAHDRRPRRGRRDVRDRARASRSRRGSATHEVSTTGPYHVARVAGLEPDTEYPLDGRRAPNATSTCPDRVRTLARPRAVCSRRSPPPTTCTSARPSAVAPAIPTPTRSGRSCAPSRASRPIRRS